MLKTEVDKLQSARMENSPSLTFASLTILVNNNDGSVRLIDYRILNSVTKQRTHAAARRKLI